MKKTRRYSFDVVRAALKAYWGLELRRGSSTGGDGTHDGRWDVTYSKTGFVVGGNFPGVGHSYRRFESLADIVRVCELERVIEEKR